ncbi:thioredoxin [Brevibacillus borstelensis]|uniref:thioredoxin family protein n=1 Tax=Brevibacillus borstelensis TaxID=45462 RepID=UPI000F08E919|nr:thioredoxin family protein [Brevibacillus borstelensis]MED1885080.1 thioredoxin family protein [Brevibacillus borstelensis]RNB55482.1 thioredoxin [Brevibacillus borstelensis]GED54409.1 thioredoxin-like protein YusE [Brevibacillus borstelensis]
MQELAVNDIADLEDPGKGNPAVVFIYTPFCGTCKLGEKMLEIVGQTIPGLLIYRFNINTGPQFAQKWEIASVPGLLIFRHGRIVEKHFAFQSVDFLYRTLKRFF